jgi:isopentenyl diphosphate isomerase/L-lactate dehydrogenase-like FMN-dependent dehydrogenase
VPQAGCAPGHGAAALPCGPYGELGARAVGVGRPLYWGLAVNGAAGVHGMLELLRQELDQVMGYCGQTDVQHLEPGLVTVPYGWGNGTMYP